MSASQPDKLDDHVGLVSPRSTRLGIGSPLYYCRSAIRQLPPRVPAGFNSWSPYWSQAFDETRYIGLRGLNHPLIALRSRDVAQPLPVHEPRFCRCAHKLASRPRARGRTQVRPRGRSLTSARTRDQAVQDVLRKRSN